MQVSNHRLRFGLLCRKVGSSTLPIPSSNAQHMAMSAKVIWCPTMYMLSSKCLSTMVSAVSVSALAGARAPAQSESTLDEMPVHVERGLSTSLANSTQESTTPLSTKFCPYKPVSRRRRATYRAIATPEKMLPWSVSRMGTRPMAGAPAAATLAGISSSTPLYRAASKILSPADDLGSQYSRKGMATTTPRLRLGTSTSTHPQ
mmetsp:Transcript_33146/g.74131  ORF Transcript_33146/g.74131 Transcript_33146/m.74131 type:complete len:203 (-) Transcript_33146:39-647(-)